VTEAAAAGADWRALYPYAGVRVPHGPGALHVVDVGPLYPGDVRDVGGGAEVVLMLHGNPTWSFYYRQLIAALQGRRRCIAVDWLGCGLSDKPAAADYPYTLEARVEELSAVLAARYPEGPLTLVVHDWGGMIGLAWAHRHPERVVRFVVLNTAAFPLPADKRLPWALRLTRTRLGAWLVLRGNAFAAVAARVAHERPLSPAARAGLLAPYDSPAHRIATLRFVQDIPLRPGDPGYDVVAATAEGLAQHRDKPALIAWGAKDFVFDDAFLREWRRRWPQAEVHRFAEAGHYVLEDEGEAICALVSGFLDAHPRAGVAG
jgi:haloalkane dehalogenase